MISVTAGPSRQAKLGVSSQISYTVDRIDPVVTNAYKKVHQDYPSFHMCLPGSCGLGVGQLRETVVQVHKAICESAPAYYDELSVEALEDIWFWEQRYGQGRVTEEELAMPGAVLRRADAGGLVAAGAGIALWANRATLADHFARHAGDFAATTEAEYANAAQRFFQQAVREGLPMKIDAQGTIRVYNPATNEFGAYTAGGLTKTYFKPTSPTYWSRQVGIAPVILGQTNTQGRG
jgi:hypothetical protein